MPISRRDLIKRAIAAAIAPAAFGLAGCGRSAQFEEASVSGQPGTLPDVETFPQSVASADPTATGVLLWTRISPAHYVPDGLLEFQIFSDAGAAQQVTSGRIANADFGPETDYTVRIDVDGLLAPGADYFYRFIYQGKPSRLGRAKTLPGPDQAAESVHFAVLTCQAFHRGYYSAFARLAEANVDFILHLGDLIYEDFGGPGTGQPEGRTRDLPSGGAKATTLEDFRFIHNTYRTDPFFQRALESATLIATWDDHEIANDWGWNYVTNGPQAPNHPEVTAPADVEAMVRNGVQAWFEWIPTRSEFTAGASDLQASFRMYRKFSFGNLADLVVTDQRWYRSELPCESDAADQATCLAFDDPSRSMLGAEQRDWFVEQITQSSARWKLWASALVFTPIETDRTGSFQADNWGAFPAEYNAIVNAIASAHDGAGVENFVTFSGDRHASLAGYIPLDYRGFATTGEPANRVGIEMMGPPVSSGNRANVGGDLDPGIEPAVIGALLQLATAGYMQFHDGFYNGYLLVEVFASELIADWVAVDRLDASGEATAEVFKRFRVASGSNTLTDVTPLV